MNKLYRKLAFTNIKNNKSLYIPYIISGMVMAAMFYVMLFLKTSEGITKIPGAQPLTIIMGLGSVIIAILSYIFIFYTNSFIIKRRKKEVGIYNILGMEKRHIAKVIGIETVVISSICIFGGIVVGLIFSKLMIMLLYKIMSIKTAFEFDISVSAIVYTVIIFVILYLLTLIYNLMQIKLANPIQLLRGGNVGEKEPKTKWFLTVVGFISIAIAYYIAITTENPLNVLTLFFVAVFLVIVGTYCLFISGSIVILKALRKNKKFYYNKRHFSAVSGMLYRMKQNAGGLASICILSTMVLVMISTTVSMYIGVEDEMRLRYPSDISVYCQYDKMSDEESINKDIESIDSKVKALIEKSGCKITDDKSYGYFFVDMLQNENVFERAGGYGKDVSLVNVVTKDDLEDIEPDFNKKNKGRIPELNENSVAIYASEKYNYDSISFEGREFNVVSSDAFEIEKDSYMSSMYGKVYYLVVDSQKTISELFELNKGNQIEGSICEFSNVMEYNLEGSNEKKIAASKELDNYLKSDKIKALGMKECYEESRQANRESFYILYGGLFFLGIFLGIMFLMVTVMIIFYKQISEGYDDKQRYEIMEKVGMSNDEVKKSIRSQVRIVFFLPLVAAAIHLAAAFPILRRMLLMFNLNNVNLIIVCMVATVLIFALIYYFVFKITSRIYYKIVGNQI